jgi:transposase-like protein
VRTGQKIRQLIGEGDEQVVSRFVRLATQQVIEHLLEAEVTDVLGRDYYQHPDDSDGRVGAPRGHRNGYRTNRLRTAEGPVEYATPQVRNTDEGFRSRLRSLLGGRSDELERLATEMYARGLSTRDIEDATRDEQGQPLLSRSAVSQITEQLWSEYEAFATRDLHDPLLVTTDGAGGLIAAVDQVFCRAERQRCLAHKMRNLQLKVPEDQWPAFCEHARACYQAPSRAVALSLKDSVVEKFEKALPSAVACFVEDFEACIAHLRFPLGHRKAIRTTNLLERLFGEERRRTKVLPHAFGERPLLKLMYAAVIRASARWRGIKVTAFDRQQLEAIGKELNEAFTQHHQPAAQAPTPSRIYSTTGT